MSSVPRVLEFRPIYLEIERRALRLCHRPTDDPRKHYTLAAVNPSSAEALDFDEGAGGHRCGHSCWCRRR